MWTLIETIVHARYSIRNICGRYEFGSWFFMVVKRVCVSEENAGGGNCQKKVFR